MIAGYYRSRFQPQGSHAGRHITSHRPKPGGRAPAVSRRNAKNSTPARVVTTLPANRSFG